MKKQGMRNKKAAILLSGTALALSMTGCMGNDQKDNGFSKIDVSQYVTDPNAIQTADGSGVAGSGDYIEVGAQDTQEQYEEQPEYTESANAAQTLVDSLPEHPQIMADLPGGTLNISTSGDNVCMDLSDTDGSTKAAYYLLDGTMYVYYNNADVKANYKISEAEYDASEGTDVSVSDNNADATGGLAVTKDISKYENAVDAGEETRDGIVYRLFITTDEKGYDTFYYINKDTGLCEYINVPNDAANDGTYTMFTVIEGAPPAEQPWMAESKEVDAEKFGETMLGFIFTAYMGSGSGMSE